MSMTLVGWIFLGVILIWVAVRLLPQDKDAVGGIDDDPNGENDFCDSAGLDKDHFSPRIVDEVGALGGGGY